MGYNCAEAINFATKRWIAYGKGQHKRVIIELKCLLCAKFDVCIYSNNATTRHVINYINSVAAFLCWLLYLFHAWPWIGPHPTSSGDHKFIRTMMDQFSRFVEAYLVRNQEATTVAKVMVEQWIARYGCPLQVLSDQGRCFESMLFRELCKLLGIDKVRTSGFFIKIFFLIQFFCKII
jgi:hypothetical protein